MEFDKSRVYTALNADEVKVGSKGYFADNVRCLEEEVQNEDSMYFGEIEEIRGTYLSYRFCGVGEAPYNLFYLVEEPEEKKFRPYKDTDEMIEDFSKRYKANVPSYGMPLIWLKSDFGNKFLIIAFTNDSVKTDKGYCLLQEVFEKYTYLDGSPCGIEE